MSLFDDLSLRVIRPTTALIPLGAGGSWYEEQIMDFSVLPDPTDATNLLMYVTGCAAPVGSANQTIGKCHAAVSAPHVWTVDGQVLLPTAATWDASWCRLGSVIYDTGTYYMYYTGNSGVGGSQIGLATSSDGTTFTKHSGPILTPTGQGRNDGDFVSEPAVIKEGSSWTMIYAYRNSGASVILPGYRYATSSDGVTWTKGGSGDILTVSPLYAEFHQIIKFGANDYVLVYEHGNDTTSWTINVARATAVTGPYTNWSSNPLLAKSGIVGRFDRYHVATPSVVQIGGIYRLFFQGAKDLDQPYTSNAWPSSIAELLSIPTSTSSSGSAVFGP